jgi:ADP-ribose pyrophosphatase YjhB (NUDIX family)
MDEWEDAHAIGQVRPMIQAEEVESLAAQYGRPSRQSFRIQADEYIYSYRWRKDSDRRAEVVFAIEDGGQGIWVHTKPHYPINIFRLPSGGVHWDEAVEDALLREVEEETGLSVSIERFLALVEYHFYRGDSTAMFASYVFHLRSHGGIPIIQDSEPISAFYAVPLSQLARLAADLRGLNGDRQGWGQWRALAHDVVYRILTS